MGDISVGGYRPSHDQLTVEGTAGMEGQTGRVGQAVTCHAAEEIVLVAEKVAP